MLRRKIQLLEKLKLSVVAQHKLTLLALEATGHSQSERLGIPMLIPASHAIKADGVFELDFIIDGINSSKKRQLRWEAKNIYKLSELPKNIKAIKVNAAKNADIVIIDKNYNYD